MRKLNFYIQSIFLGAALLLGIASIVKIDGAIIWLLQLQFFVGIIQMVVAIKLISVKRTRTRLLEVYMSSAVIFLLLFIGGMEEMMKVYEFLFVIIPWCLAILFCVISYRLYKEELS